MRTEPEVQLAMQVMLASSLQ